MKYSSNENQQNNSLTCEEIANDPPLEKSTQDVWKKLIGWNYDCYITPRNVRKKLGVTPKEQKEIFEQLSDAGLLVHYRTQVSKNRIENWVMVFRR